MLAVHGSDLPLLDLRATTEKLRGPSRIGRTDCSLVRIASSDSQDVVVMQRPDVRSTNRDKPTHPSMPSSAGITLSRIWAIPASMDEGCALMVVLRAYMIRLRYMWGSVSTAPPDYFIVLPQARHGNGWRVSA